ncbi:amino acid transporter heavy chain SLC3A2-like [Clavelina lepadiformis]|uniref:amino acid transporter heavy chain SLC3A2-like n=1 Tax=Clavelina lepadiformis TaxID=159417 RepID=UPI004042C8C9
MGSPEKPIDVEMGDMNDETKQLNPDVKTDSELKEEDKEERFTGLKKEELMEIANQPHWVRARWALFIIFWIIWVAMLAGAIFIVVTAPKCKPEPTPQWYQDVVVYEAKVDEFAQNFKGMEDHLDYVSKSLFSKAVMVAGAGKESDPAAVTNNDDAGFESLVKTANEKEMKVMVDIPVDTLSTMHDNFAQSATAACASDASGMYCNFFVWKANGSTSNTDDYAEWVYNPDRMANYKVSKDSPNRAFLNYESPKAWEFVKMLVKSWFDRKVDGIQIRDVGHVQNIEPNKLVKDIWEKFYTNETSNEALFVYSSSPNPELNPVMLDVNNTNTGKSPMILSDHLSSHANLEAAGKMMRDAIEGWRNSTRQIGANLLTPLGGSLVETRFSNTSMGAALNLLSISIPGVPVIRSGDEVGASSPVLTWEASDPDSAPVNSSNVVLNTVTAATVRKVEGIQAMQSLRYDTRNEDTKFSFIDTDNNNVIAFHRKWDTKPSVLVVSNLSPSAQTVNVVSSSGLMDKKKPAKKAKVVVSSSAAFGDGKLVELDKVNLPSGTTLILGA